MLKALDDQARHAMESAPGQAQARIERLIAKAATMAYALLQEYALQGE
ncbi:hypothetical protein [Dactylosporangium sp. NPDC048998]